MSLVHPALRSTLARQMSRSVLLPRPGSEFEGFLFAPVGDDKNGMLLSVLSALARLDVDPWAEAANLARLPYSSAITRLASLIATLPGRSAAHPDPETIAARLIALLPGGGSSSNVRPRPGMTGVRSVTNAHAVVRIVAINLVLMACMLGAQWIGIGHRGSPQVAETPAAISGSNPTHPSANPRE
jgi:hypothetical protein